MAVNILIVNFYKWSVRSCCNPFIAVAEAVAVLLLSMTVVREDHPLIKFETFIFWQTFHFRVWSILGSIMYQSSGLPYEGDWLESRLLSLTNPSLLPPFPPFPPSFLLPPSFPPLLLPQPSCQDHCKASMQQASLYSRFWNFRKYKIMRLTLLANYRSFSKPQDERSLPICFTQLALFYM